MVRPAAMTVARRALTTQPALRRLLPPSPRRPLVVGTLGARSVTASWYTASPLPTTSTPASCPRRWYSVGGNGSSDRSGNGDGNGNGDGDGGSRIWTFTQVKDEVEAQRHRPSPKGQPKVVFVDVREHHELQATGKVPGALHVPLTMARRGIKQLAGDDPARAHFVFYCRAGVRARTAARLAADAGCTSVGEYPGSWIEWEARGGPVEKVLPDHAVADGPDAAARHQGPS